jgi:CIC family chloride channel protein
LLLGALNSGLVFIAKIGVDKLTEIGTRHFLLPIVGALLVGGLVYYWDNRAQGLGTNIYISSIRQNKLIHPGRLLLVKLSATILTLGLIGVGGLVGPLLLLGSTIAIIIGNIMGKINLKLGFLDVDRRVLSICGAAAALGPWLGAPLGGGIFASEVLYKSSLDYNDLFPALLSSSFGYFFYQFIDFGQELQIAVSLPDFNLTQIILLIFAAVICGLLGQGFILIFKLVTNWFADLQLLDLLKPVLATGIVLALAILLKPEEIDSVSPLFSQLFSPEVIVKLLIFKIAAVIFIVGSGGSAAVVDVAFFAGALAGQLLYYIFPQLPLAALVIVGLSATLASIANVPLATIILVLELLDLSFNLPVVIGGIIGFLVGRPRAVFTYIND